MSQAKALCWASPDALSEVTTIERRDVGPHDVLVDLRYARICHSDVHHVGAEIGHTFYPIVPGHEIAGVVAEIGSEVTRFAVGERVGVGTLVDSCREYDRCPEGRQSYCRVGKLLTYNARGRDGRITQGGYSEMVVVDEEYVVRIPEALLLDIAAPLLCGGITMYSPLKRFGAAPGRRVAILGFGGLRHLGVQLSHAMGAHTTVLNNTTDRIDDALRLGADDYRDTIDPTTYDELAESFDLVVSSVPVNIDVDATLGLLGFGGTLVNLGVPERPLSVDAFSLLTNQRTIAGSMSAGIPETKEMVDFCTLHGIGAQIEVIAGNEVDKAFDRLVAGDVRYRFVIDIQTMAGEHSVFA
jgi:uncharacterized zinc-type alcohol dehydrogenase-like protein